MEALTVTACLAPSDDDVAPAMLRQIESRVRASGGAAAKASYDGRRRCVDVSFNFDADEAKNVRARLESLMATVTPATSWTLVGLAYYADGTLPF
jgi:hypothetical protein